MAAKLRPRVILTRFVSSTAARAAEARGRQLQRLVGRQATLLDLRNTTQMLDAPQTSANEKVLGHGGMPALQPRRSAGCTELGEAEGGIEEQGLAEAAIAKLHERTRDLPGSAVAYRGSLVVVPGFPPFGENLSGSIGVEPNLEIPLRLGDGSVVADDVVARRSLLFRR